MAKRRIALVAFLLCFCFWLTPCVSAASTTDATEQIDPSRKSSLALSYSVENVAVKLYKIADVSADLRYNLTPTFASTKLVINGIKTNSEWNTLRSTLETYIAADKIAENKKANTDGSGKVYFNSLDNGLYLALADAAVKNGEKVVFEAALVALPNLNEDGSWEYQVSVASKSEIIPPPETEKEITQKVLKLWKGDLGLDRRPEKVEIEIFKNGAVYKKVVLSKDNNWSYSWTEKEDGSSWSVIERKVPSGYTMTVSHRDGSFVITNVWNSDDPIDPFTPPQTGDTSNIMLYVIIMIASGFVLIIVAIIGKRNDHEDK